MLGVGARLPACARAPVSGCGSPAGSRSPATAPAADSSWPGWWRSARRDCRNLVAAGWCISPWVDMEMTGETMTSKSAADPMVQRDGVSEMARLYLNGADPRSPLAAPLYADLAGIAPLLIQVGAAETLLDDPLRLAKLAGAADVRVELQIWPEMVHVWHLFHPEVRGGKRAIEAGGAVVRAHTSR